jgi:hypothetical protein
MHKIIITLLFLIVLLIPNSEVIAQGAAGPNPAAVPTTGCPAGSQFLCATTNRPAGADGLCDEPDGSKSPPVCINVKAAAEAAEAATAGCKIDPKTGKSSCTSAKGIPCGTVSGSTNNSGGIMTAIGCIPSEPKQLVEGILWYGTIAVGGIAFLLMILAALQMITAEGNPESIKHAQERFYSAIIGLLLIIFSVLLMQVIGVDILNLPGFKK